eukprot:m.192729 g.192729  ORF g.192729 m.192729 type:complete len:379 (+) comp16968_c0_seq2:82-1218(+)
MQPSWRSLIAIIACLGGVFASGDDNCSNDSCLLLNRNTTIHELLRENLFLKEMLRKAAKEAESPSQEPWWKDRRADEPDTKGVLGLYYATPIFRTNINLVMGKDRVQAINRKLEDAIMAMYLDTVDQGLERENLLSHSSYSHLSDNEINNDFFTQQDNSNRAQRKAENEAAEARRRLKVRKFDKGQEEQEEEAEPPRKGTEGFLDHLTEMTELKEFWHDSVERFWDNVPGYVSNLKELRSKYSTEFFYWAAVSHHNIEHKAHVHFRSYLSGVYYVKTPPLSGPFHFNDPRGYPMYPYNKDHTFQPTEGDLVIFPGFVPHSVDGTPGPDPRVAIAFNLDGNPDSWREMTDVFKLRDIVDRTDYYSKGDATAPAASNADN